MILPTKGIAPDKALISVGARILEALDQPKTVSRLWAELRERNTAALQISFDWFVLGLDLLYAIGTIDYAEGQVRRVSSIAREHG